MIANPPVTTYFTKFEKKKKILTVTKPMRAYLPASSFPSTIFSAISAIWSCNAHACTDLVQSFFPQTKSLPTRERDQTHTNNSSRRRRCQAALGTLGFHASNNKGTPSLTIVYRLWDNFSYIISNQTTAASSSSDTYLFFMQITQLLQAAFWWVSTIMLLVII